MDLLQHLGLAFQVAFEPLNLFLCLLGVFVGTMVGVLPGLGPTATISLLLPVTFKLGPVQAIIMLAGIAYGAFYGGSTTSILINIPGEAASVVTCIDGYQMARRGRAGPALGIAAFGSFIGGTFALVMLAVLAPPIASAALNFGPPEFFALALLGLTLVTYLSSGSMIRSLMMAAVGLLLGYIGADIVTGNERFTFGFTKLIGGIDIVPSVMGLFGISEVLLNIERSSGTREVFQTQIKELLPTRRDWGKSIGAISRGSVLGFFLGVIPGGGALIASFASYALEKKIARDPENFGKGDIRGVAGPETANNAGAGGAFIPLLTIGIPCNVVMAVLMGAFMIHGVIPGPRLMEEHPSLFWGVLGSMYIGNVLLLVLNLPLIGLWVKILKIPYALLFPLIFLFCLIGSYTLGNNTQDIYLMIIFGVAGYLMKKYRYEPAPLILALVLGPTFENGFRQSLILANGNPLIFLTRPLSAVFVIASLLLLLSPVLLSLAGRKRPGLLVSGKEDF
ncbi:MAG TPA: tripartite tricarboxylate transporter permease [Thermodesulfobacteriota bacterium]|nr:tripartite tricarboxylate transporter permease [Thermodesulfobacteriota bacterium]